MMAKNGKLRIPTVQTLRPCEICGKEATKEAPNRQYTLVGFTGVLCPPCLDQEVIEINLLLTDTHHRVSPPPDANEEDNF